ncbi:MAG: hypothetical protein GXX92_06885, partial [Clostridiales bacterium]|nr:hypothetical protein [Clostridiales bacterium]
YTCFFSFLSPSPFFLFYQISNSLSGLVFGEHVMEPPLEIEGAMWHYDPKDDPTDDCFRAGGDLWRVLTEDKKELLIQNTAGDIAPCTENIKYRHAAHCYLADGEYGKRFAEAAGLDLDKVIKLSRLNNKELIAATI